MADEAKEEYKTITLDDLTEEQTLVIKMFMFNGVLNERERLTELLDALISSRRKAAEASGSSSYSKTITFDEVKKLIWDSEVDKSEDSE